jgi:hypothetical protein
MNPQHHFMYPRVAEVRVARPSVPPSGRPAQRDLVVASLVRCPGKPTVAKG